MTHRNTGITLLELLLTLATISTVAAILIVGVGKTQKGSEAVALHSHVKQLNASVQVYLASGGNLDELTDVEEIFLRLKTKVSDEQRQTFVGFRHEGIDARLEPIYMTGAEAGKQFVQWDATKNRFVVRKTDGRTDQMIIVGFKLGAEQKGEFEEKSNDFVRKENFAFAKKGNWVWDFVDGNSGTKNGPVDLKPGGDFGEYSPPLDSVVAQILNPPVFSLPGGTYPLSMFDGGTISLTNVNEFGTSVLMTAINGYGGEYTAPINLTPGLEIAAFASAIDSDRFIDSHQVVHSYQVDPMGLRLAATAPKTSFTYAEAGGALLQAPVGPLPPPTFATISLANGAEIPSKFQSSDNFQIFWTTDGSDPSTVSPAILSLPPFAEISPSVQVPISVDLWPAKSTSAVLRAQAVALNSTLFANSAEKSLTFSITTTDLSGPEITWTATGGITLDYAPDALVPAGSKIIFTLNGPSEPLEDWEEYTKEIPIGKDETLLAQIAVPEPVAQWFLPEVSSSADSKPVPRAPIYVLLDEDVMSSSHTHIEQAAKRNGVKKDWINNEYRSTETGNPWLNWSQHFPGDKATLPAGQKGDEGWFLLPDVLPWSLEDFVAGTISQSKLDKIKNVQPLGYAELKALEGRDIIAICFKSDISMNYGPTQANLQGERLGRFAFTIDKVTPHSQIARVNITVQAP